MLNLIYIYTLNLLQMNFKNFYQEIKYTIGKNSEMTFCCFGLENLIYFSFKL